jgi:enamine deaminase RidA (YjgF/YER057c/UK114 family)
MHIEHLNPEKLHRNPAFTQAILVPAGARTAIIGGQNAVDADGEVVGKGDIGQQAAKALDNLIVCLEAAGAGLQHLAKVTIFIADSEDIRPAFGAWMARWGDRANPPAISVLRVGGFANPDFLIEIEAMAVLP